MLGMPCLYVYFLGVKYLLNAIVYEKFNSNEVRCYK
jgi:hypothetical protein